MFCGAYLTVGLTSYLRPLPSRQATARAQVNVEVRDIGDYPAADLQALTAALRTHPQAITFRVSGQYSGGMYPKLDKFTYFYDWRTQIMRGYGFFWMRQAPERPVAGHWQKTDMTEAQIARAASEATATPWEVHAAWRKLLACPGKYTTNAPL